MSRKKLFVVTMYRFGDREKHSYVIGVWDKYSQASKNAAIEEEWRGGKYGAEIVEVELGVPVQFPLNKNSEKLRQWKECGAPDMQGMEKINKRFTG